jgi:single-stranded-DNA-specific exonuclease
MRWKISEKINKEFVTKYPDIDPVILQLLHNRNIESKEEIDSFLNSKYEDLHDPFLFNDMEKLVSRVKKTVELNEIVYVYGDYDADGVCSSILMVEALRKVGIKEVGVYIPHREHEGYGLNNKAIDHIKSKGTNLIITVDCGTSNVKEVAYAKSLGIDVIILDHHKEPPELPKEVTAILNPHLTDEKYPFKNLAAVGVVFKVVQALWKSFNLEIGKEKWFLDIVCIATIADMMDLTGENRILVKYGLVVLNKTKRVGLNSLINTLQYKSKELGVYEVGFLIGPRINAAGRIEHATGAYELLETSDTAEADSLAQTLNTTNLSRQSETKRILDEALEQVRTQLESNKVLIAKGDTWSAGVVGLVSGRITQEFYRPSLVVTKTEKGITGSGRSIPGFNITDALEKSSEYLESFGGHEGACGFTLKSDKELDDFVSTMNNIAEKEIKEEDLEKKIDVDTELLFDNINFNLVEEVDQLAPFGMGNTTPKFVSFGVRIDDMFLMGRDQNHIRLNLQQNGKTLQAVGFGIGKKWGDILNAGDLVDIVYDIGINEWNNKKDIQLKIVDIKKE